MWPVHRWWFGDSVSEAKKKSGSVPVHQFFFRSFSLSLLPPSQHITTKCSAVPTAPPKSLTICTVVNMWLSYLLHTCFLIHILTLASVLFHYVFFYFIYLLYIFSLCILAASVHTCYLNFSLDIYNAYVYAPSFTSNSIFITYTILLIIHCSIFRPSYILYQHYYIISLLPIDGCMSYSWLVSTFVTNKYKYLEPLAIFSNITKWKPCFTLTCMEVALQCSFTANQHTLFFSF